MIISFYDKNFKALQNNAGLDVDLKSYKLVKRPVEFDSMSCTCEIFTENIQPAFLVVKDDVGRYMYGCLAGVPLITKENTTKATGTDLKSILSSDVILTASEFENVNDYINYMFSEFTTQVNKGFDVELVFKDYVGEVDFGNLEAIKESGSYNVWNELKPILKFYNLFIESKIDLVNKKVVFEIGKTMNKPVPIRLYEYKVLNVGKWIAPLNECQGVFENESGEFEEGTKWILLSSGNVTTTESLRDIYPVKKNIIVSTTSLEDANKQALEKLLENVYKEDIVLNYEGDFQHRYDVIVEKGKGVYKSLPCGELRYDSSDNCVLQIGFRYTGAEFI